jgi:hypothetical protein
MKNQDTKIAALKLNNFIISDKIKIFLNKNNFSAIYSIYFNKDSDFGDVSFMYWLFENRCLFIFPHKFLTDEEEITKFLIPSFRCRESEFNEFVKKYPYKVKNRLNNLDYLLIPAFLEKYYSRKNELKKYCEIKDDLFYKLYNYKNKYHWTFDATEHLIVDYSSINEFLNNKSVLRFKRKIEKI